MKKRAEIVLKTLYDLQLLKKNFIAFSKNIYYKNL